MDNKTNKKKVIIIGNGYKNSISDDFFKDVIEGNCENAYYYFFWEVKNPIINFIRRIYFTKRWNIYKKIPWFVNFFKKYNALERVKKEEEDVIVIINLASQYSNLVTKEDISGLKKNNVTLILFCIDAIDSPQMNRGEIVSWFPLFDYVICDNPEDAEHYGIYYHLDPYPWKNYVGENNKIDNYLFFLGRGKDRTAYCRILADFLDERKIEYDFSIIGNEKRSDGIKYLRKKVPYSKIIKGISTTNCILEVLSYNNGASLRYFEAVVFNKKLLTTNKDVYKLPYYNPKYMKVIDKVNDIDLDWLRSIERVDYGYKGDFSPESFINDIRKMVKEKR